MLRKKPMHMVLHIKWLWPLLKPDQHITSIADYSKHNALKVNMGLKKSNTEKVHLKCGRILTWMWREREEPREQRRPIEDEQVDRIQTQSCFPSEEQQTEARHSASLREVGGGGGGQARKICDQ